MHTGNRRCRSGTPRPTSSGGGLVVIPLTAIGPKGEDGRFSPCHRRARSRRREVGNKQARRGRPPQWRHPGPVSDANAVGQLGQAEQRDRPLHGRQVEPEALQGGEAGEVASPRQRWAARKESSVERTRAGSARASGASGASGTPGTPGTSRRPARAAGQPAPEAPETP